MRFAHPTLLWLIPAVTAVLLLAFALVDRRRRRLAERFTGDPSLYWSATGLSKGRRFIERALLLGGLACLIASIARPLMFFKDDQRELQGISFLVAIDASRSMLATDVQPTRYAVVTNALDKWLAEPSADRIGIITFAGAAYLNAPLTFDTSALRTILQYIEPQDITEGGSSITTAIERAGKYFVSNNIPQRVLVVISDGEELEGNAIEATRRARRQLGMTVSTIGVGTLSGSKVPARRKSWEQPRIQKNTFGQEVVTKLDEGNLRRVANAGGGKYFPLGENGQGLRDLREMVLKPLAEAAARDQLQNYREMFQFPLALALLCFTLKLLFRAESAQRRPTMKTQPAVR